MAHSIMLCRTHLLHGTTTILPTAMSASRDMLACVCHTYRTARAKRLCPNAVGLHLEGPFLSPAMCGAQRTDLLREPDEEDRAFLLDNKDIIRRVTAAPEVRGVPALAAAAAKAGIRFSMGHTNATYEQAEEACSDGNFTSVTHLYCATSGFHKVDGRVHVGVTQYAYADRDLFAELIGEVVWDTKTNLEKRMNAECGACEDKMRLARMAKEQNLDAVHDTVHEMAKDEARHGKGFEGLYKRYFGK